MANVRQLSRRQRFRQALLFVSSPIVILFLALAAIFGRRAGCHSIRWMAPFLVPRRRIGNLGRWPDLRLEGGIRQVHRLPEVHAGLPDEPGRQWDGKRWGY